MHTQVLKTRTFKLRPWAFTLSISLLLSACLLQAQECGPVRGEKTGRIIETGNCNDKGQRHGEWTFYYDTDLKDEFRLKARGSYSFGKKSGTWTHYDTYGPYVLREATYVYGRLNGPYKDYYDTGNKNRWIKSKGEYKEDKRAGQWTDYWDNGCYRLEGPPKEIAMYKNGIKHGESATFYDSNCFPEKAMASRGFYDNGKKDGEWKYYNDEGSEDQHLIKKFNYDKGAMSGTHYFYENGRVSKSFDYTAEPGDEGEPTFNEAGQLTRKDYKDYYLTFYEKDGGTPPLKAKIENADNGIWLFYFESGALNQERTVEKTTAYYESGKVKYTYPALKGNRNTAHGTMYEYYESGKLQALTLYLEDLRKYGAEFDNNGNLTKFSRFDHLESTNWYVSLWEDGSIKETFQYRNMKKNKRKSFKKGKNTPSDPPAWIVEALEGVSQDATVFRSFFEALDKATKGK